MTDSVDDVGVAAAIGRTAAGRVSVTVRIADHARCAAVGGRIVHHAGRHAGRVDDSSSVADDDAIAITFDHDSLAHRGVDVFMAFFHDCAARRRNDDAVGQRRIDHRRNARSGRLDIDPSATRRVCHGRRRRRLSDDGHGVPGRARDRGGGLGGKQRLAVAVAVEIQANQARPSALAFEDQQGIAVIESPQFPDDIPLGVGDAELVQVAIGGQGREIDLDVQVLERIALRCCRVTGPRTAKFRDLSDVPGGLVRRLLSQERRKGQPNRCSNQ